MNNQDFIQEAHRQLAYLVDFARKSNELDLFAAMNPEFRGMQDAGWNTSATAFEVADELERIYRSPPPLYRARLRQAFALYAQLSEAGGFYETLSNVIGILAQRPYTGWPFHALVRVKKNPARIIGPNANAVFRDLATKAEDVGLVGLAAILETAFRDDLRNAISHSDYIFADEGIRLRQRNGGNPVVVPYSEFWSAVERGFLFFNLIRAHWRAVVHSFHPTRTIYGRFSANIAMKYEVGFDPATGALSLSTSSPGQETSAEYLRQEAINQALGTATFAVFQTQDSEEISRIESELASKGISCRMAVLPDQAAIDALRQGAIERAWQNQRWEFRMAAH